MHRSRHRGAVAVAGIGDTDVGILENNLVGNEKSVAVRLVSGEGTQKAIASKAIAAGVRVYTAASGKVSDTQGTGAYLRGIALTAAGADGDVVEIIPLNMLS